MCLFSSFYNTQVSHWFTIFASLGEDYEPSRQYTLNDFQLFEIYDHSDIIFEICHDAMQQEKLRAKVCYLIDDLHSLSTSDTLLVLLVLLVMLAGIVPLLYCR